MQPQPATSAGAGTTRSSRPSSEDRRGGDGPQAHSRAGTAGPTLQGVGQRAAGGGSAGSRPPALLRDGTEAQEATRLFTGRGTSSSPAWLLLAPSPLHSLSQAPHTWVGSASCPFWHGGQICQAALDPFPGLALPRPRVQLCTCAGLAADQAGRSSDTVSSRFPLTLHSNHKALLFYCVSVCASPCTRLLLQPHVPQVSVGGWEGPEFPASFPDRQLPLDRRPCSPPWPREVVCRGLQQAQPQVHRVLCKLANIAIVLHTCLRPPRPGLGSCAQEHLRAPSPPRASAGLVSWPLAGAVLSQPPSRSAFSPASPCRPHPL